MTETTTSEALLYPIIESWYYHEEAALREEFEAAGIDPENLDALAGTSFKAIERLDERAVYEHLAAASAYQQVLLIIQQPQPDDSLWLRAWRILVAAVFLTLYPRRTFATVHERAVSKGRELMGRFI